MTDDTWRTLIDEGRRLYAPTRIGRPGRGLGYWPAYLAAQLLRLNWRIRARGRERVQPGPAILVGNHLSLLDPVLAGVTSRWRLTFFTKVEAYQRPGAFFFRWVGQIPLRRGDEPATQWALRMSSNALTDGNRLCVYPEATRSPDGHSLHRLHMRVLVPILRANPSVPVHAMTVRYGPRRNGRVDVDLRYSEPLQLDPATMTSIELTNAVRDALLETGRMPYVHAFGRSVKGLA